jgi:ankyrin repeat protein
MKGLFTAMSEFAVLVGIVAAVLYLSPALDRAAGMPSADERFLNAAWDGDEFLVDQALADGASIHARSADGSSALTYAAWAGHAALVERLIALGVNVNGGDNNGITPLMYAASNDHGQIVRMLLTHGADPRTRASCGPFDAFNLAENRTAERTLAVLREWEQDAHEAAGAPVAPDQQRASADGAR